MQRPSVYLHSSSAKSLIPVFVRFVLILCNMALRITVQGHAVSADCYHFKAQSLLCVGQHYSTALCTQCMHMVHTSVITQGDHSLNYIPFPAS